MNYKMVTASLIVTSSLISLPALASSVALAANNPANLNVIVTDTITQNLNGTWHYSYKVNNATSEVQACG